MSSQRRPVLTPSPFAQTQWDTLAKLAKRPPKSIPQTSHTWAILLSLCIHGLLMFAFIFAVTWKASPAPALQAELWDAITLPATPLPPPSQAVADKEPPAPSPEPEPDVIAPKIVKEKARPKEKEQKPEPKPAKPEEKKPVKDTKHTPPDKPQDKKLESAREKELARLNALMGKATTSSLQVGPKQGLSSNYKVVLQACVEPNFSFADATAKDLQVEMNVRLTPNRNPIAVKVVKPSGNALFDAAVERALLRCDPFPKDVQPLATDFNIVYRR